MICIPPSGYFSKICPDVETLQPGSCLLEVFSCQRSRASSYSEDVSCQGSSSGSKLHQLQLFGPTGSHPLTDDPNPDQLTNTNAHKAVIIRNMPGWGLKNRQLEF